MVAKNVNYTLDLEEDLVGKKNLINNLYIDYVVETTLLWIC